MKHIVKVEIDNKRYGIPEEVFNYIKKCCNKINEIEEENKQLKEQLEYLRSNEYLNQVKWERDFNEDLVKELQQRIDKAIQYIESYNLPKDLGCLSECPISVGDLKELLKILKGEN